MAGNPRLSRCFGPGPTSPETAAAHLAELCNNLRQQVLRTLDIPPDANHHATQTALLAAQIAGAEAAPEPAQARPTAAARSDWQARQQTVTFSQPAPPRQQRQVGLDLGGVITMHGQPGQLVPGAAAGVAQLVAHLGRKQVSIISRADSTEAEECQMALLHQLDFFSQTRLDSCQVYWARAYQGPESKGPWPGLEEFARGVLKCMTATHRPQAQPVTDTPRSKGTAVEPHTFRG